MRRTRTHVAIGVAGMLVLAAYPDVHAYDFFGSDLAGVLVVTPDQCAAECDRNASCAAWTFVRPPLKHPTSPVCYLKSAVVAPSLNSVCTSNAVCLSGIKRSDGWCGETPLQNVGSSGVPGQGQVLSCPAWQSCRPRTIPGKPEVCWFLFFPYPCHGQTSQTTGFFCQ
jgi:hypothetical protein